MFRGSPGHYSMSKFDILQNPLVVEDGWDGSQSQTSMLIQTDKRTTIKKVLQLFLGRHIRIVHAHKNILA